MGYVDKGRGRIEREGLVKTVDNGEILVGSVTGRVTDTSTWQCPCLCACLYKVGQKLGWKLAQAIGRAIPRRKVIKLFFAAMHG